MPRRPVFPSPPRRPSQAQGAAVGRRSVTRWLFLLAPVALAATIIVWVSTKEDPARLALRAEAAAKAGNKSDALKYWRALNRTSHASARSLLEEARASLALNRAAQAERALVRAVEAGPADPAPWLLRLGLLHVENRILEAQQVGWEAYSAVSPTAKRDILRALTLALLTEPPDDSARDQLDRWIAADPADMDAVVALLSRIAAQPRAGDPDRGARIAKLTSLLDGNPKHLPAREALVVALADAGELGRGRELLDAWPAEMRDARYYRLAGRWDLDYEHQPAQAVRAFRRALMDQPHDWRTHYRLSRALSTLGKVDEARREAETVARLREALEPENLGHRLVADFDHLEDPQSRLDLGALCATVGLDRLAEAWRLEVAAASTPAADSFGHALGPATLPSPPR
jgi:tetratricopeptide (TPR) repeat protein